MTFAPGRFSLDAIASLTLAATVIVVGCGSSSFAGVNDAAFRLRWVGIAALALVGLAGVLRARRVAITPWLAAPLLLVAFGLLSAVWSVAPKLSLQRGVALSLVVAAAAAFAGLVPVRPGLPRALARGIVAGATALALAGFVVWLARPGTAIQPATVETALRYRGFGGNPNTFAMLYALALPLAVAEALAVAGRAWRLALAATVVALVGSISASGSHGGIAAAVVGVGLTVLLTLRGRRLAAGLAGVAGVAAIMLAAVSIPKPNPVPPPVTVTVPQQAAVPVAGSRRAEILPVPVLTSDPNELGRPRPGQQLTYYKRTLFGSSGRAQAWDGAIRQALQRPLLGFGFGTEGNVFIDRYYVFNGGYVENTYISMLMQLGVTGLVAFIGVLLLACAGAVREVRRAQRAGGRQAWRAGFAGATLAGVVIAVVQSFASAAGNVATVAFWIAVLLVAAPQVARARWSTP